MKSMISEPVRPPMFRYTRLHQNPTKMALPINAYDASHKENTPILVVF